MKLAARIALHRVEPHAQMPRAHHLRQPVAQLRCLRDQGGARGAIGRVVDLARSAQRIRKHIDPRRHGGQEIAVEPVALRAGEPLRVPGDHGAMGARGQILDDRVVIGVDRGILEQA